VIEAENGAEALRICEQPAHGIDLVLSDMAMPEMTGPELARRIRSLDPAIALLLMSGYTGEAVMRYGFLDPGTAFVEKPFTPEALVRKVREVLDGAPDVARRQ
jgi:CheY-like chemotaxis protein